MIARLDDHVHVAGALPRDPRHQLVEPLARVETLGRAGRAAGLDAREVEQLVGEVAQAVGLQHELAEQRVHLLGA